MHGRALGQPSGSAAALLFLSRYGLENFSPHSINLGTRFDIVLVRDAMGDLTSEVEGFSFVGEFYELQ